MQKIKKQAEIWSLPHECLKNIGYMGCFGARRAIGVCSEHGEAIGDTRVVLGGLWVAGRGAAGVVQQLP